MYQNVSSDHTQVLGLKKIFAFVFLSVFSHLSIMDSYQLHSKEKERYFSFLKRCVSLMFCV